jgi:hypothetical protein
MGGHSIGRAGAGAGGFALDTLQRSGHTPAPPCNDFGSDMQRKAVEAAERELELARDYCRKALETKIRRDFDHAWHNFLMCANRVFTRLEHGAKKGPSKGWFDAIKNLRKTDPLLNYMMHARNASEHGDPVLGYDKGAEAPSISRFYGSEAFTPEGLTGPPRFSIEWQPRLLPVKARNGVFHHPPTSHLGKPIVPVPEVVAETMIAYRADRIAEAHTLLLGHPVPETGRPQAAFNAGPMAETRTAEEWPLIQAGWIRRTSRIIVHWDLFHSGRNAAI